jgi:D-erythro-7,8-dihydroneopterin triphosphate epimerase
MIIKVKNLLLRTLIGFQEWEREKKQDVVINLTLEVDDPPAVRTDDIQDTVDYREITKRVIEEVEASHYMLLERLAGAILDGLMVDPKVRRATVEIDKPHALRFSESVSVTLSRER